MKKIFLVSVFAAALIGYAYAQEPQAEKATEVGNAVCPVSGEKVDSMQKVQYEHEGKIYNFCCPACIDEFDKEPHKYIAKLSEGEKEEAQKEAKGEGHGHEAHEHHHH